jgi:hypothetical protein
MRLGWIALGLLVQLLPALELDLAAPLSTRIGIAHTGSDITLHAIVTVPRDAAPDLGCAAWVADRHGRWWQRDLALSLTPGTHRLDIALDAAAPLRPQGHVADWNVAAAAEVRRVGLIFWSARPGGHVRVDDLRTMPLPLSQHPTTPRLIVLRMDPPATRTGQRWSLRVRPEPWPMDPWDPDAFALTLQAVGPDGQRLSTAGFHDQPMRSWDRGDREEVQPWGETACAVRTRATAPGTWHLQLDAHWADGSTATAALPDLMAQGPAGDHIARVDAGDPRFFSADGQLVWPIGPNLHSIWDVRGLERTNSRLTPDRGTFSYRAWFDRLAASGANACEIWLSSWNLALEWRGDWYPWRGVGRISDERAWQLDRVLDLAEARGIRVNLVVMNHGQASQRTDAEWNDNPANRALGGWLDDPADLFSDPRALAAQDRSRRHLIARYGDSPAILGWKLWSEVNLTELGHLASNRRKRGERDRREAAQALMIGWHQRATERWHALDPWQHPTTTHWAGNYRSPDRQVAAIPTLDYLCIDAYHGPDGPPLWTWLCSSTADPDRPSSDGLASLGKPVLVTEYGGNWDAAPEPQLKVALAIGGWVGLVAGHAGAPMLWWHEWLDQRGLFGQYQALSRFIADEDLRGADRRCIAIQANAGAHALWARAWTGPGRMLGYILDQDWARSGGQGDAITSAQAVLGEVVRPGQMHLAWWDADSGEVLSQQSIAHAGGRLAVAIPAFRRHLAFKLWRVP